MKREHRQKVIGSLQRGILCSQGVAGRSKHIEQRVTSASTAFASTRFHCLGMPRDDTSDSSPTSNARTVVLACCNDEHMEEQV